MTDKPQIRVLVVEDKPNWRDALCRMYEQIFTSVPTVVEAVSNGPDALRRIKNEKFHLLSCDINLGTTHPVTSDDLPDLSIPGADGRTVLRRASESKACNGVVVITGIDHDEELSVVIRDEDEVKRLRMTLDTYLEGLFPGKKLCLKKDSDFSVPDSIDVFKQELDLEKLLKLCDAYNRFCREGEYWCITFNGKTVYLKDSKGLNYIACLLNQEGKEVPSTELVAAINKPLIQSDSPYKKMSQEQMEEYGMTFTGPGDGGEMLDSTAKDEYRRRLKEIEEDLEEVRRFNDTGRVEKLEEEKDFLFTELKRAVGLGGRTRKATDTSEKARQAVSKRIHSALEKLAKDHPELHVHLSKAITVGLFCGYSPTDPVFWSF